VGQGAAAPVGQIQTRRGNPLCHIQTHRPRALSKRRPYRDRLQHRRAGNPAANHHKKNALFAGSHGGGRTWAAIATLLQTAKINRTWLMQTLERNAQGWPISQIDALMPWHFKA